MATAQFSGQYGHNMSLELRAERTGQDIAGNSSTVRVTGYLHTNGYASVWGVTSDTTATINGADTTVHPVINIGTNSTQKVFDHTYTIGHNNDGTKTVGVKLSVTINAGGYGASMVAFDLPLPTIPRASSVSDMTGTLGSQMTININRKNSDFKHTVKYNFGALNGTIATNVDTSVSWTPPLNLATAMPNKTSDWGNITVDTYSGSTKIGSATCRLTLNVPDSIKPSLGSITLTDTNTAVKNLLNTANTFVQVMSNIKVTFNDASGSYGSTISSYRAEIVGKNQNTNSNNGLLGMMNFNGSVTIRATVTDSRGRTSDPVDVQATVIDYFTPQLSFSASRSGSDSTTVTVTRNAKIAPLTVSGAQKNKMKLTFKYKEHSSSAYTTDTGSANGTWTTISSLTNSNANLGATFSVLKSYDIIGTIEDSFTSYDFLVTIGTESFPLALKVDRMGLGKLPEQSGVIDSAWEYYYGNKPIQHHKLTNNDGTVIILDNSTDLDNVLSTGLFVGYNLIHHPQNGDTARYYRVSRRNDGTVLQESFSYNGDAPAFRVRNGWAWGDWKYYAVQNTVANFTTVNQTKVYSQTIAMPFSNTATVTRIGNQVQLTWNRAVSNFSVDYEYTKMVETVPAGYRPVCEAHMPLSGNVANSVLSHAVVHLGTDGAVRMTVSAQGNRVWSGTITYLTSDPFPS